VSAREFADSAFDCAALLHPLFERISLLLAASMLQKVVMLTGYNGAMRLSDGHTLRAQPAAPTMVTPLEAKAHVLTFGFFEPTALGIFISSRTASSARGDANIESLDAISAW
jgi:hypothetical protein